MAENIFFWIKEETILVNLNAVAYIRFGDEPGSTIASHPGIVFRAHDGQKEEIIPLEKEEAERIKDLLKPHFKFGAGVTRRSGIVRSN
jgi:hypothetical protein